MREPLDDGRRIAFIEIAIVDGSYHEIDTDDRSVETAAFMAVRDAITRAALVNV